MYDRLRAPDTVHFNPKGFWLLWCDDDVAAAQRDPRFSNRPAPFAVLHARHRARFIASDVAANLVAFQDAPEHTALRRPLASACGKRLRRIEADVTAIAAEVPGQLPAGQGIDAVSRFAASCALRTTARMIGLSQADPPRIADWSSDFVFMFHGIPTPRPWFGSTRTARWFLRGIFALGSPGVFNRARVTSSSKTRRYR